MDINGLREMAKNLREDFITFKSGDFQCLEKRVDALDSRIDKLSTKVGWMMGIIGGIFTIVNLLVRFL